MGGGGELRGDWSGVAACWEGTASQLAGRRLVRGGALAVDDELAGWEGAVSAASGGDWRELDVVCPNEHGVDWSFQQEPEP